MGSSVSLRDDMDAAAFRLLARRTGDADQGRRLLALAAIHDGGSRGVAARNGSVGRQTVRLSRPAHAAAQQGYAVDQNNLGLMYAGPDQDYFADGLMEASSLR